MDLVGQFILCQKKNQITKSWQTYQFGEWLLGSHPKLPVIDIIGKDDFHVGWLLGYPISLDGELINSRLVFNISINEPNPDKFENQLYSHGGRFAAVYFGGPQARFYLDPCGSLAAVFSPRHKIVASTPTLIPYSLGCDDDHKLIESMIIPGCDCCYPFGLTPRRYVKRLLPNHYLDLNSWKSMRHWPMKEFIQIQDIKGSVQEFATILRNQIAAVAHQGPFYLPLTGGRDSRLLLACSRNVLEKCHCFTIKHLTKSGKIDCQIVKKLCRRFNLPHKLLDVEQCSQEDWNLFRFRTGWCVEGQSLGNVKRLSQLDTNFPILFGVGGELGRPFHWRRGDIESSLISAKDLVQRITGWLHTDIGDKIQREAQKWLETIPVQNALTIWGLLYNEQYNGCWIGPKEYALASNSFSIWPFCHRSAIEIMLSLPADYRQKLQFVYDVIESQWLELLKFPFNWPTGWRRVALGIHRAKSTFRRKLLHYQ